MDRGLVEILYLAEPSKSIYIYISKEEIIDLCSNWEHWAARAIANEDKPIPVSEEVIDFLYKTEHSTFGV
jgi:hypothetical protein